MARVRSSLRWSHGPGHHSRRGKMELATGGGPRKIFRSNLPTVTQPPQAAERVCRAFHPDARGRAQRRLTGHGVLKGVLYARLRHHGCPAKMVPDFSWDAQGNFRFVPSCNTALERRPRSSLDSASNDLSSSLIIFDPLVFSSA